MTRPNGISTNYTYDSLSRLLSVLHQSGTTTLDGAIYTVDNAGNRTSKADQLAGVTSNFTYDSIYELTGVTQGTNTTESYSYDPVGNRTASLGVASYTTNASNEMTANSNASFTYDDDGNTASKTDSTGTTNYSWDYENRLTSVTLPGSSGTVSFKYDPFGRRIYKSSSSATSIFAYDGDNLVEEANSSGSAVARYSQGLNIDEPLAMLRSSSTSYYNADGLGSITSLGNAAGTLAQTYTFDSFGKQTASSGSLVNPFQFTGREFDSETGLYFLRARYFDSQAGRFLSEDPIGFSGGDINVYRYSFNDPVNLEDPSGLTVTCTYNQSLGTLRCTDDSTGAVVVNTRGYSGGNEGACPACVNNPFTQSKPFAGPIPTGYWTMSKCFTGTSAHGKPMPETIRLSPTIFTSPAGSWRSPGFLIHGGYQNGSRTASNGCIVIGRPERHAICQAGGGTMNVISGLPVTGPSVPFVPLLGKPEPFGFQ